MINERRSRSRSARKVCRMAAEARSSQDVATSGYTPTILVVDDDPSMRAALADLFRSVDHQVVLFQAAPDLLRYATSDLEGCLVLDIRLPGLSGLELQKQLADQKIHLPIIFMTGYGDIPMSVRAMKAGAVDFLSKPFRDQDMLDAVAQALKYDARRRRETAALNETRKLHETLTVREREVMGLVASGLMNKQIAAALSLSEVTVKIHRGTVMKKMNAKSLAELVRMDDALNR